MTALLSGTSDCDARLVGLIAGESRRGPRRDGLYAVWLVVRTAEGLLPPAPVSRKNHQRRLQALEVRLVSLALPAPLKRALVAARTHLAPGTAEAAAVVLSQLVAPVREVLGAEAAGAILGAAQEAQKHRG